MRIQKVSLMAMMAASGFIIPAAVSAQTSESAEADDSNVIIVTARSREENIQNVPIAITAITAEDIEKKSIEGLDDVARFTAGFSFESLDGGNGSPSIRGQTTINNISREQTTATFFDGVYLPRSWLVDSGTSNLARVEVVKGPQSSRFGRNAFAGAINFIPNKANTSKNSFNGSVTYGNYDRFDIGGNVNLILEDDVLAVAGSYNHSEFDGSWRNNHPFANLGFSPGTNGRVGGHDNQSYSLGFVIKPSDRVTIEAAYYGFDREEEAGATLYRNTDVGQGNCGTVQLGNSRLFCGEFPAEVDEVTVEPRSFSRQSSADIVRANANFEINDEIDLNYTLGFIKADTLAAITAESDTVGCGTVLNPFILLGNPRLCNFQASPLGELEYTSHEARLSYDNGDNLRLSIGGYLLDGEDNNFFVSVSLPAGSTAPLNISRITTPFAPGFPFDPNRFANFVVRDETTLTDTVAIFGEIGFAFNEGRTRISAEGRYTTEEINTSNVVSGFDRTTEFNFFTPRVTIEHDISDESLLYASAARGVKSGGFNSGAVVPAGATVSPFGTFDPESNWTFEIGSKNQFLDGRATVNAAVFYTDWKDQQVNASDPNGNIQTTVIVRNLGDSRIFGAELESQFQATDDISIDLTLSYTDAKFKNGTFDQVFANFGGAFTAGPCDGIVCAVNGDVSGNELPRAPKFQAAMGIQYETEVNDETSFYIRADGSYQSRSFADTVNVSEIGDRLLVNARAGVTYNNFSLSLWGRNIFDKRYVSNSTQIVQAFAGNILSSFFGDRRTLGATLSAKY